MKDMKIFYIKLLVFQTIFYALFWSICYTDALTDTGRIAWKPMVIIYYVLSVICTFIIPMITEFKRNNNEPEIPE